MVATASRLDEALRQAGELGLMPASVAEIQKVADNPRSSLRQLEKAVALDPLLTARILKFANTAHYGRARQITDLKQAVITLGMRAVRDVAIGMAVAAQASNLLEEEALAFLEHSLHTAVVSMVMEVAGSQAAHDAFVCGLLHDMGQLVMVAIDGEKAKELREKFPEEGSSSCFGETLAFGFNHCQLAAECLDRWGLPGRVVHAVRHHHDPTPPDQPTALLVFSDAVATMFERGDGIRDIVTQAVAHPTNRVLRYSEAKVNARLRQVRDMVNAFRPIG